MVDQLKSEFKKLLTIRSTYVFLLVCLAITILFAFYVEGYRVMVDVTDAGKLAAESRTAFQATALFISLVGMLLVTHEYRYNTIMYTLTASRSRAKVFFAKVIAVTVFALLASLLFAALAPLLTLIGLQLHGTAIVPQSYPFIDILWRGLLFSWGYAMLALITAFIVRSQVGAIVTFIILPFVGEGFLSLLLKENAQYLPFVTLGGLQNTADVGRSVLTILAYVLIGGAVALLLFRSRDAN